VSALPEPTAFLTFGLVSPGMVCPPGPTIIRLVSRSIAQGRKAGLVSLLGVAAGFFGYLLPQFVGPKRGAVLAQSPALGLAQVTVTLAVNACIVLGAGSLALWLTRRPVWLQLQRRLMATLLGLLAVHLAKEHARP
jgi:threonine/homoserine/homoserine lactone efflux protein